MRIPTRLLTAALAGVVGSALVAAPAAAKGRSPGSDTQKMEKKADSHSCKGENGCKGEAKGEASSCKGEASCKGHNECKGQGKCKTESHACKGQNECKGQGGCA